MKNFTITHEQRTTLLKAYNDLMDVLSTLHDIQDLYLSDIRKLDSLDYELRSILKFDNESSRHYYSNYKLAEDCKKSKKGA